MHFASRIAIGLWSSIVLMSGAQSISSAHAGDSGWEAKWSVITVASNGAWGASINRHKASARLAAIRECRARSADAAEDCGERTAMVLGGWVLAYACGSRSFVVAESTLEEAKLYARYRETEMRFAQGGGHGMPRCKLTVSIDPSGAFRA